MDSSTLTLEGYIIRGHQVASQSSTDYPYGTIEKQKPLFKERGLDLYRFFNGTLNISIAPRHWLLQDPLITFEHVKWTELHPPETFSFLQCSVLFKDLEYQGWIYYPHPDTKQRHFQDLSVIEVITEKIPDIHYGDAVQIVVETARVKVMDQSDYH